MEPHFSFTIPSVHDDTPLSSRVYHPEHLSSPQRPGKHAKWDKKGIVVAHPYAPLGGSYDDRIVGLVVSEFLKAGWIVGTFNFRGAQNSKGSTSWTGRPELDDYASYAAFFLHYVSFLQPLGHSDAPATVIFAGYSYGSLILRHLPPVPSLLQPFAQPVPGSSAGEVLHRACKLANEDNAIWCVQGQQETRQAKHTHRPTSSVTIGGEEIKPEQQRISKDIRTNKQESGFISHFKNLSRHKNDNEKPMPATEQQTWAVTLPRIRYLLISPLTTPTSTLVAPALVHRSWTRTAQEYQDALGKHPTLAVFGDHDMFSSAKKIRDWTAQHIAKPGSMFSGVEIAGAGHFWVEEGVEEQLRLALREWEAKVRP